MQSTSHLKENFGQSSNGYIQKQKEMGTMILAIKGLFWTAGNWILLAFGMATMTQWALYLGMLSASVQIGYTSYKWIKDVMVDLKSGKKKLPFRPRKNKTNI